MVSVIGDDSSVIIFPVTSTLEISNVLPRHEGAYRCVATNEGKTRASRDAQLIIMPENSGILSDFIYDRVKFITFSFYNYDLNANMVFL